jgi:hypothetical protein
VVHRLLAALAAGAILALVPAAVAIAAAEDGPRSPDDAVAAAAIWLSDHQRPDGGFDGFVPGGNTPDAVLALAESAQTSPNWSNGDALERVESDIAEDGSTPLSAVRVISRRVDDPGVNARLITRIALPLGLDPGEEGSLGDLIGQAGEALADDDVVFVDRVESAIALLSAGAPLPDGTIEGVVAAQQANGGWNADGDPDSDVVDLRTTGAVLDLVVLAGADPEAAPVPAALAFVGSSRNESGAWPNLEGELDATATAGAIRAIQAVGHDPDDSCWETELGIEVNAVAPVPALMALQQEDGGFVGDNAVLVTSEAVHALSGRWLPLGRTEDQCTPEGGGLDVDPSLIVLGAIAVVGVGGGARIMRSGHSSF